MEVTILNPLKRKQKVIATIDLPGVPEGTEGRIRVANGIEWFRYWVDFDNGTKLGRVDHDDVVKVEDWEQFKIDRENALNEPEINEDKPLTKLHQQTQMQLLAMNMAYLNTF